METGDRVINKRTENSGFISDMRGRLAEVKWDDGRQGWLPTEELRAWDRSDTPPEPRLTPRGNTTPPYLLKLRLENPVKRTPKPNLEKIADGLVNLSSKRKNRSKMKARRIISEYERKLLSTETSPSLRTPQEWEAILPKSRHMFTHKDRVRLNERIARDDRHEH